MVMGASMIKAYDQKSHVIKEGQELDPLVNPLLMRGLHKIRVMLSV